MEVSLPNTKRQVSATKTALFSTFTKSSAPKPLVSTKLHQETAILCLKTTFSTPEDHPVIAVLEFRVAQKRKDYVYVCEALL